MNTSKFCLLISTLLLMSSIFSGVMAQDDLPWNGNRLPFITSDNIEDIVVIHQFSSNHIAIGFAYNQIVSLVYDEQLGHAIKYTIYDSLPPYSPSRMIDLQTNCLSAFHMDYSELLELGACDGSIYVYGLPELNPYTEDPDGPLRYREELLGTLDPMPGYGAVHAISSKSDIYGSYFAYTYNPNNNDSPPYLVLKNSYFGEELFSSSIDSFGLPYHGDIGAIAFVYDMLVMSIGGDIWFIRGAGEVINHIETDETQFVEFGFRSEEGLFVAASPNNVYSWELIRSKNEENKTEIDFINQTLFPLDTDLGAVTSIAMRFQNDVLVVGHESGYISFYDIDDCSFLTAMVANPSGELIAVNNIIFMNSNTLVSISENGVTFFWGVARGTESDKSNVQG